MRLGPIRLWRRLPPGPAPRFGRDERLVAWAQAGDDTVVLVTNHGVWLPGAAGPLGWHEINKATWSGRQLALVGSREVAEHDGFTVVEDVPAVTVTLLEPDDVPDQVRARVTRSIAYTSHHPLPWGGGLRVVARRVPGVDGLRWTVRYDAGTDTASDRTTAIAMELVAQGRASIDGARA